MIYIYIYIHIYIRIYIYIYIYTYTYTCTHINTLHFLIEHLHIYFMCMYISVMINMKEAIADIKSFFYPRHDYSATYFSLHQTLVYLGSLPFVSGYVAYDQCVCAGSCCPQISTGGRGAPSGLNQMALRIETKSCRLDICFSVGSAGPEARLQFRGGIDVRTVGRRRIVL